MLALITGASSGIGRDMARVLSSRGYDLILVARRQERLMELKQELKTKVEIIALDLSEEANCRLLYEKTGQQKIDILINNAGFASFGAFLHEEEETGLRLIKTNVCAVQLLMRLFLPGFVRRDSGYILNVSSVAAFMPGGPLLADYYAAKSYVLSLTYGIYHELKAAGSHVYVGALCPGPVRTEFDEVAGVKFHLKSLSSEEVARYAIDKMLHKKLLIMPGATIKMTKFFVRLVPDKLLLHIAHHMQSRKIAGKL